LAGVPEGEKEPVQGLFVLRIQTPFSGLPEEGYMRSEYFKHLSRCLSQSLTMVQIIQTSHAKKIFRNVIRDMAVARIIMGCGSCPPPSAYYFI
jgi:hypothetical protein